MSVMTLKSTRFTQEECEEHELDSRLAGYVGLTILFDPKKDLKEIIEELKSYQIDHETASVDESDEHEEDVELFEGNAADIHIEDDDTVEMDFAADFANDIRQDEQYVTEMLDEDQPKNPWMNRFGLNLN